MAEGELEDVIVRLRDGSYVLGHALSQVFRTPSRGLAVVMTRAHAEQMLLRLAALSVLEGAVIEPARLGGALVKVLNAAQQHAAEYLNQALTKDYRVGAMFLSYTAADGQTHIASASGMRELDVPAAVDLQYLVEALRRTADDIERTLRGEAAQEGHVVVPWNSQRSKEVPGV